MDYFFRCQKSTFNLEVIDKEFFLLTSQLDLLTSELFFELCISQRFIQKFERNWRNSVCIRVNKFVEFVNF